MASKYDGAEIEIVNWDKHKHKDFDKVKNPYWFKVDVDLFLGAQHRRVDIASKGYWGALLAWGCKYKRKKFRLDMETLQFFTGLQFEQQDGYIEILKNAGYLRVIGENFANPSPIHRQSIADSSQLDKKRREEIREEENKKREEGELLYFHIQELGTPCDRPPIEDGFTDPPTGFFQKLGGVIATPKGAT